MDLSGYMYQSYEDDFSSFAIDLSFFYHYHDNRGLYANYSTNF